MSRFPSEATRRNLVTGGNFSRGRALLVQAHRHSRCMPAASHCEGAVASSMRKSTSAPRLHRECNGDFVSAVSTPQAACPKDSSASAVLPPGNSARSSGWRLSKGPVQSSCASTGCGHARRVSHRSPRGWGSPLAATAAVMQKVWEEGGHDHFGAGRTRVSRGVGTLRTRSLGVPVRVPARIARDPGSEYFRYGRALTTGTRCRCRLSLASGPQVLVPTRYFEDSRLP
jgi:hypothetical protein